MVLSYFTYTINQTKTKQSAGSLGTRRESVALKEIKDFRSQHAPQLLEVFKMKSLLTLICENFFSEMRAGSHDMPLQLPFDFRFSRALKEHFTNSATTPVPSLRRQSGRVVRAPDLKSVGRGFKSRSDH